MKFCLYLTLFIFLNFKSILANTIEFVDVNAKGSGASYTEALNNSLSNAVAKVNGRSIETQTTLSKISEIINTESDNTYYSSKEFQKKINEKTNGYISSFQVVEEELSSNNIVKLKIFAKIGKFKLKKSAKRKRIAVLPFYFVNKNYDLFGNKVSAIKIDRLLTQSLVSYLVQTRKFTVLDREYLYDINSELSLIHNNETNIEESVKLGQKIFSDYILVGTLENLTSKESEIKIKNSNNTVNSKKAFIEFNYRIIDVPTSQIMFSDDYRGIFDLNNINSTSLESYIMKTTSIEIGSKILNAIYPLRIEKINGNLAYIGQGGLEIEVGEKYNIIELGDKIKDTYTNEYIGREEINVGILKITDVGQKLSTAEIIKQNYIIEENFEPKRYIIKLIKSNKSDIDKAKEIIKQKENEETADDDW